MISLINFDVVCGLKLYNSDKLQLLTEELVHLCHLGGNTKINGSVTNLDNKPSLDVRVYLAMVRKLRG